MAMREWLESSGGKIAVALLILIAGVAVFFAVRSLVSPSEAGALSRDRLFICSETGKQFRKRLEVGMTIPVMSPFSGKATGYEAELCYWTKDGQIRKEPYPVLLNTHKGKPEPTFCPDCGRLVKPLNPAPSAGDRPPPTEAEYKARRGTQRED
jgi:hypothetical protein